ncbi:hypothetical protein [Nocardia sp. NPDC058497]|uniref:hypothetical protein n=1 Tax=Nocardia sp. NPDC058497 TaxID=3346529 RepID=UPI00364D03DF
MGREPIGREAADRIGAAADRDPASMTAISGFANRADAAAARNDYDDEDDWGPKPA